MLDWLREEAGAKGTKEGCGEGDCGACTVVLARLRGGRLATTPVNACILLLGQLDGAEVITVEDLADGGEPPSGAAGDGRLPRLPVRLLHAGHRDEPVRRLSLRRARDAREPQRARSPATSAAAPATGRSSRRGSRPATARPPTASRATADARAAALAALADGARPIRRRRGAVLRRPREPRVARGALRSVSRRDAGRRRDRRRPMDHQAVARPRRDHLARPGRRARRGRARPPRALCRSAPASRCWTPRRSSPPSIPISAN